MGHGRRVSSVPTRDWYAPQCLTHVAGSDEEEGRYHLSAQFLRNCRPETRNKFKLKTEAYSRRVSVGNSIRHSPASTERLKWLNHASEAI